MKKIISYILLNFCFINSAFAQEIEMANIMRSSGKIYVVVAVLAVIYIGLIIYLYQIDQRVRKLEK